LLRTGAPYGQAWRWSGLLFYFAPTIVRLEAVNQPPTPDDLRDMHYVLREQGIEMFHFARKREDGTEEPHTWDLIRRKRVD
jgi:hypothetical protein